MVLVVLALAQFTTTLEFSVVFIALPSIAADVRLTPALAQWIPNGYAIFFAGFLMVGGQLADRIGGRRLFLIAITGFGAASALGAAATTGGIVLAARCAQGAAAALLQPAILQLIGTGTPAEQRSKTFATWSATGALGLAAGAVLGGLLTELSWRLVFLVNVPLCLLCALGAIAAVPRDRHTSATPIPLRSAVLATAAVLTLVLGLTLAAERESVATLAAIGTAAVLALSFVHNERTSTRMLIVPALRRNRSLHLGATVTALYMASAGSTYYLLTLLLQSTNDYTPLETGLAFLPLTATVVLGSAIARYVTPRTALATGFATVTAGLLWLALTGIVPMLPGLVLSGLGNGMVFTAMFVVGTREVPAPLHGTAGALLTTSQYLSSALAIALLTIVLGQTPDLTAFRHAFLITTAVAAIGIAVAVTPVRSNQ